MTSALLVAVRVALASAFAVSAFIKVSDLGAAAAEVRALTGLEPAGIFAWLVIATQAGGAVLLVIGGRATQHGAALLGAFTLVATIAGHPFWATPGAPFNRDLVTFCEHLGLIGGLALAAVTAKPRH